LPQNFVPAGFSVPQLRQSILGRPYSGYWHCTNARLRYYVGAVPAATSSSQGPSNPSAVS
jgi:hypothetical protein